MGKVSFIFWLVPYAISFMIFYRLFKKIGISKQLGGNKARGVIIFLMFFLGFIIVMSIIRGFIHDERVLAVTEGFLLGILVSLTPNLVNITKKS